VFYQHHPFGTTWGPMYWGHMKSKDLVHWTQLPIAFGPSWDKGESGCWSGSCVAGPGGLPTAIYTSVGPDRAALDRSEQWLAIGSRDLSRWEKSPENPVMTHALHGRLRVEDWRDPYAWRAGDAYYCVAGGHVVQDKKPKHNPAAFLYKSQDMVHWTFLGPMCSRYTSGVDSPAGPGVNLGTNWECPLFFPLGDRHVLEVSVSGTAYTIGTFKDEKFVPAGSWHALDHSDMFYAPHTFADARGRRVVIGWVRTGPHPHWTGCFSLPRVVTDRGDGTLGIEPLPELDALHGKHVHVDGITIPAGSARPLFSGKSLAAVAGGRAIECRFAIPLAGSGNGTPVPPSFELQLYEPVEGKQPFIGCLGYEPEESLIFVGNKSGAFHAEPGEHSIEARLFIDRGVVELFINGRWALTNEIPIEPATKLVLVARGIEGSFVSFEEVDCWAMASIWG
ncbi:MAG: glycoside hydrolase family 32 protein, partial [Candidatus Lokiarchaeota archaeon]|nr:glycoside hydrolase family 32 protein [Candidatus Lokiarchaeota archaeon]